MTTPSTDNTKDDACPGCEQAITITDGVAECGGEGEGICCWAHYALNVRDGRPAVWEWTEVDDPDPPSNKLVRAIVEAFDALPSPCDKCGVYVPTGEHCGNERADGTSEYLCPDCYTPEGE
jgi:hypothetical protein